MAYWLPAYVKSLKKGKATCSLWSWPSSQLPFEAYKVSFFALIISITPHSFLYPFCWPFSLVKCFERLFSALPFSCSWFKQCSSDAVVKVYTFSTDTFSTSPPLGDGKTQLSITELTTEWPIGHVWINYLCIAHFIVCLVCLSSDLH